MKGRKLLGNQKKCDYHGDGFKELNQKGRSMLRPITHRIIRSRLKADILKEEF
jgi:hypothetical protein